MKKFLFTNLFILLFSTAIPFQAQAIFPGEKIVFGNRDQSNEQSNKTLIKIFNLATKKDYQQALDLIEQKIQNKPKIATLHVMKGLVLNEEATALVNSFDTVYPTTILGKVIHLPKSLKQRKW